MRTLTGRWTLVVLGVVAGCGTDPAPGPTPDPCAAAQAICTFAGTGAPAFNGDGLPAKDSMLYWPVDLDFAPDGRAYLLDWNSHRVRRVDAQGRLETVMGTDLVGDGPRDMSDTKPEGAPGTTVDLNHPTDLGFMPDGAVLVAAWHNHKIRRLDPATGRVTVVVGAGPGRPGPILQGDGGPAKMALLTQPKSVVADRAGNIYITDSRFQRIRRIDAQTGIINTVAGTGTVAFAGDGAGPMAAAFYMQKPDENPEPGGSITLDEQGRLYLADTFNNRVRRVDFAAGTVSTVAGNGTAAFSGDGGPAVDASLSLPRDVEIGPDGRLYIADTDNHRIRAVDLQTGVIATVVGTGKAGFAGDEGPAAKAELHRPFGIAFDGEGRLYVADTYNNRIRRVAR